MKKIVFALCLAALLGTAPATAQVDLSRFVALGDSLTAGFASGGLTIEYQNGSYPALLAERAGTPDYQLPLVTAPGIPSLMELLALPVGPTGPTPVFIMAGEMDPGFPINAELPRPYDNLGVPGADLYNLLFTTGDISKLIDGTTTDPMHDLILRFDNTALEQAIGLQPTFLTLWIGNNDYLSAVLTATPIEGMTMTPVATFEQLYQTAVGALVTNTAADIVLINLPDATLIPFANAVTPYLDITGVGRIPLIGSKGVLPEDALVTLGASSLIAQGIGVPVAAGGTGIPLPEDMQIIGGEVVPGVVLRSDEVAVLQDRVNAYNDIIEATAISFGLPMLDANALFGDIAEGSLWVLGGVDLSAEFLTGGIFSYDGIHPQKIGYGLVAIELIDLINDEFNASIPQVNMGDILCGGSCDGASTADTNMIVNGAPVMSAEAFLQLQEIIKPRLDRMRRNLSPGDDPGEGHGPSDDGRDGVRRPRRTQGRQLAP